MLIGLNLFEGDAAAMKRQAAACRALETLAGVEAVDIQFAGDGAISNADLPTLAVLAGDSTDVTGSPGPRKPIALEMFDALASAAEGRGHRYFAYINSDIVVTPQLVERVRREVRQTYAISRCDVGGELGDRMMTAGQDMFVVSVEWWRSQRTRFRPYILGEACWDNVYTAIMMCHSDGVVWNRSPLILHESHATAWRDTTATARYNGYLAALDARYFHLWCQYWHRLDALRAKDASESAEVELAHAMFVWKRSVPDAMRQLIRSARARRGYQRMRAEWLSAVGPC